MCGRYVVATPYRQLELEFGAVAGNGFAASFAPNYNTAPTDPVPVVWQRREDEGERRLSVARWGLIPYWAKDPGVGVRAFNARVETAAEKPMFRSAFARRRCVLPADGYYEWKKDGARKQPMFIHAADGGKLAFAGLYERWIDPGNRPLWSVSILTGPALGPLAEIHDRMPLALARDAIDPWLDEGVRDVDQVRSLLDLTAAPAWTAHPVGPEVGNVRNNGPELIRELTGPETLF
ncbi:SOS response-associated peptidase [Actinospica sp. MGRD01-02]|uniref:Abasic site processing protein n=1 Tax=Actinospica acidithermotolerans TaxID=2828514 RepID=A0A941EEN3_9ACTN|nr:SOS response-associated peptidase [Actinospica acidithermotolerans]MBR7829087.1 SOS response-associated peptidase [Actinospica acidithermotolerans]